MNLPTTAFSFLWHFIKKQSKAYLLVISITFVWAINDTFFPFFLKKIVNTLENFHGLPEEVYGAVSGIVFLLMTFWVTSEVLLRAQGVLLIYMFPRFRANIRETVFDYVKSHSHEYFSNHFAGNLAKKLADLPDSSQLAMEIFIFSFTTATIGACIIFIMMWLTKPIFAAVILLFIIFHLGITSLFLRFGNKQWAIHSDKSAMLSGKIVDAFSNITNVRLFGRGKYELSYMKRYQDEEIVQSRKAMWAMELTRMGLACNGLFLMFSIIFLLIYGWAHKWVTIGDFTQVGMQSFWLLGWIWMVSYQMTIFAREMGTIQGALSIITKRHDVVDAKCAKKLEVTRGEIQFDHVNFSYQKDISVFEQFDLTIPAGQKVGLVGFSGSGKTTLVNLVLRFYDLHSGKILIDGQDIAKVTQDSLRAQISVIPQDPSLFHRTLMENIRYGRLDASDAEVVDAAKLAHCDEFIRLLPEQYASLVGERGIKLSGGQRQRIAIARAILKNAPILILDEATSSLDSVTEKLIQESLQHLMRNRTTIVIAHRLSTLTDMDRILVFHKGKIVEDGSKNKLLLNNGHFKKLWDMQTDGFLPDEGE